MRRHAKRSVLFDADEEMGLELNAEKTGYVCVSPPE
jgi:hypothetical protein